MLRPLATFMMLTCLALVAVALGILVGYGDLGDSGLRGAYLAKNLRSLKVSAYRQQSKPLDRA